ncbi:hypothetical protein PsAD46_03342 [Pseudovibrio sp. Ad46]|uniref:hypothetical protein n=1 Tax=Pseudovibrio sp. Ad46 TaxID=989432 RepID=UPI0007AE82F2|nr:hypothetical protein [Pseudovibrio sp. Ad46]KZK85751.1 hypothetical protein PsAD46_03342 [Pseudovibrio sp. Ad46]
MNDNKEFEPRLKWRRSWPDTPDDGTAKDPNRPDANLRTYKEHRPNGPGVQWYWVANDLALIEQGLANSKEEAQQEAERAYFEYLERQDKGK